MDVGRLSSGGPDLRCSRLAFRIQDIAKDHFSAFATKHFRFTCALPTGATTNQGNFTIKSSHNALLLRSRYPLSMSTLPPTLQTDDVICHHWTGKTLEDELSTHLSCHQCL